MSERSTVQNPMFRYAEEIGWQYVSPADALKLRGDKTGLFFTDTLTEQLIRLNPGIVTPDRAAEIIRQLSLLKPTIAGNRDMLAWLRGEGSVFVPEENRERNVRLIDFDDLSQNCFQITDEWAQQSTVFTNRADVVFLINGIPVAICETKSATKRNGLEDGITQIRRYHRETPELFLSSQVFEVTQLLDFYYGVTWNVSRKGLFNWKDEVPENYERRVKAFFDQRRFLKTLKDYIIFLTKDDVLSKVILRQHQTRAVEKVIDRVHDPHKRRGLIWHTQGSGKTLTMITIAANLLRDAEGGEKPTVVMLVDRNELESQLFKNIAGYGITNVDVANSKRHLQQILASDYRGLVVSMIHKFDDVPANLNQRHSIVVLVDEAHRTTGGDLGNYLMAAIPNATLIGFTGTPIDNLAQGKGTFKVFGADDEQGYLDKYPIIEAIPDGTTVPLNYALAPSNLLIDRDTLNQQFLDLAETEGLSDPEELNAILDRAVELKEALKSDQRLDQIAAHVAGHFTENVEPMGFKAFLVAVDREACALYKQKLDQYLPANYSQVVYSPAQNDSDLLKTYYLDPDAEKALRRDFLRKDTLPKILIVTEKLLTGFDAPILYCLYLDKPMRDHVLLQAIARVNRPYEDETGQTKPYGFVLDFVGIFEKLEKALAFDSDTVASVIQNVDVLKRLFATLMQENAPDYFPDNQTPDQQAPDSQPPTQTTTASGRAKETASPYVVLAQGWDDKAKERAIAHFEDKTRREQFYKFFRQLQNLYDILSPDAFLRPFMETYQALSGLYGLIRNAFREKEFIDPDLTAKTRALLRENTTLANLQIPGEIHQLGQAELQALREGGTSDATKVLNLKKILSVTVATEGEAKPFLLSIGERADAIAQAYDDRQLTTQEALAAFEKLAQEVVNAESARQNLNVDENTYAIYTALELVIDHLTVDQARMINATFEQFPDYQWNEQEKANLRTELYKVLRSIVPSAKLIATTNTLLNLKRL